MLYKVTLELISEADTPEVASGQVHSAFSALVPAFPNWRQIQTLNVEEANPVKPEVTLAGNAGEARAHK